MDEHIHDEFLAFQQWTQEASTVICTMAERIEALEHELLTLRARVREWEVGPR